jgi:hypothetical protein
MSKRKTPRAWVAYKIAKIGKRLGVVYGETEKEALANYKTSLWKPWSNRGGNHGRGRRRDRR